MPSSPSSTLNSTLPSPSLPAVVILVPGTTSSTVTNSTPEPTPDSNSNDSQDGDDSQDGGDSQDGSDSQDDGTENEDQTTHGSDKEPSYSSFMVWGLVLFVALLGIGMAAYIGYHNREKVSLVHCMCVTSMINKEMTCMYVCFLALYVCHVHDQ